MASYVMSGISIEDESFLEETQNLVLKMLGLMPLEFDEDVSEEGRFQFTTQGYSTPTGSQFEIIAPESICSDSLDDSDLETDDSSAPILERVPSHAAAPCSRVDSEECRMDAVAEKLEKMAEQILCMYKDEFRILEEDLESYSSFSSFMRKIIPSPNPMWYQISMLFSVSRYLVKKDKKKKSKHVSGITSFTVEYIKDNFADYIIENGGWDSVASVSLQEIEGDMFCEMPNMEKAAFENFLPPQNTTNEMATDGKPTSKKEDGSPEENSEGNQESGDCKTGSSSSFELNSFFITASAAAAIAVAYAVMKT